MAGSPLGAVILAAGGSTRLGRPKQLLELRGEPLVQRAARIASEAGFDPVVVVVGAEAEAVSRAVVAPSVTVTNADWRSGAASSIRAGVEALVALRPDVAGTLILACDQPLLEPHHLAALATALGPERPIAAARYAGTLGVPALFDRQVLGELLALDGDRGAKRVLTRDPRRVAAVDLPEAEHDIDTEGDWSALRGRPGTAGPRRIAIPASPMAPSRSPAGILVREAGAGPAVVLLHGGWGWEVYPFDLGAVARRHRVIAPDRVGYGGSGRLADLPSGFHRAMAEETFLVMDALGLERAALWGHSDGAVVAAWMALLAPERVGALVLEALHFFADKPSSEEFFRTAIDAPERFGPGVVEALRRDHGEGWRGVLAAGGRAWLSIIAEGRAGRFDLFEGRFGELAAPTLLLHGRRDPRTEPGELEAARRALPSARLALVEAGHCPHASERAGAEATRLAVEFLEAHAGA